MSEVASGEARQYGLAAGMLTAALAAAGLLTYGFFALASHSLSADDYGQLVVLWSLRVHRRLGPLPARRAARRRGRSPSWRPTASEIGHALRVAGSIQLGLALAFVAIAFALRDLDPGRAARGGAVPLLRDWSAPCLAFGASFFARGFLAGERRFGLFSALLLLDGAGRLAFSLAVAVGIAEGVDAVASGRGRGPHAQPAGRARSPCATAAAHRPQGLEGDGGRRRPARRARVHPRARRRLRRRGAPDHALRADLPRQRRRSSRGPRRAPPPPASCSTC